MTASPRKPIRRMSEKRLKALGGRAFSTVSKPSSLPRRSAPKKKRRSKSEFARIYGPPGYVGWIHEQKCMACGYSPCEAAHIESGGIGRKADWTLIVPLCGSHLSVRPGFPATAGCHGYLHRVGRSSFELYWGINLTRLAAEIQARWHSRISETEP